jgi:aryl-alcohol dehydrogenase-like predicted oxidoreductase
MQRRMIGSLEVTAVGLGTNSFGFYMEQGDVAPVVDAALDAGINFFDTADIYRTAEEWLGAALGRRRSEVVIASKFGNRKQDGKWSFCGRPDHMRQTLDASLERLGTDYIDLYQLHGFDADTPMAETLGALSEAHAAGKIREVGCSNFSAAQLEEAVHAAAGGFGFVSVQNHYNLLNRADEADVIPACERLGISYIPYWPLASGVLTGKYERDRAPDEGTRLHRMGDRGVAMLSDEVFDQLDALTAWAAARDHSLLELSIAWLTAQPAVASVIAGATRPTQVTANARAGSWTLTADDRAEIDALMAHSDPGSI